MRLRQLIKEDLKNNIHRNIGINSLKNVAMASKNGTARFIILKHQRTGDHVIHAGDSGGAGAFHNDLIPHDYWNKDENRKLPIGGYLTHKDGNFHYSAYEHQDDDSFKRIDDHPVLNKMRENHGVQKGIWSARGLKVRPLYPDDKQHQFEAPQ